MGILGNDKKTIVKDFVEKVKELVTAELVKERLVKLVSDREADKQANNLAILLGLIHDKQNDIRKIKPDVEHFAEDGTPAGVYYSKGQSEALKKAKELLAKMEKAFEKGIGGDLSDVYNFTKDRAGDKRENKGEAS